MLAATFSRSPWVSKYLLVYKYVFLGKGVGVYDIVMAKTGDVIRDDTYYSRSQYNLSREAIANRTYGTYENRI